MEELQCDGMERVGWDGVRWGWDWDGVEGLWWDEEVGMGWGWGWDGMEGLRWGGAVAV